MKNKIWIFSILMMVLFVTGCSKDENTLNVAYFDNITHGQALVMKSQNMLQTELGNDMKVKWFSFDAGTSLVEALFSKDIDIGYIGPVPTPVVLMIAIFIIAVLIVNRTQLGRHIYAVGGNAQAAQFSGINVQKVKFIVYTYTGIMSGIAGIIVASRLYSGQPTAGDGAEMDAIAAVVVGGTSMSGGSGRLGGTLIGVLIIGVLNNGLNLMGVDSNWQYIVKGVVILLAVYVDFIRNRKAGR